jgi:hypothetical protein
MTDEWLDRAEQALARQYDTSNELLHALIVAHRQIDALMGMVMKLDDSFRPSQWPLWPDVVKRAELIRKHGGEP